MSSFNFKQKASATVDRKKEIANGLDMRGFFTLQHIRDNVVIHEEKVPNGVTNEGKDLALDVMFHDETKIHPWYIGLIDDDGSVVLAAADTMGSHAGWTESVKYSELTRQEYDEAAASSQSTTSSTTADFSINDTDTIYGVFITSDSTKSATAGTLWATAAFDASRAVVNGDTLRVTYTVNAT